MQTGDETLVKQLEERDAGKQTDVKAGHITEDKPALLPQIALRLGESLLSAVFGVFILERCNMGGLGPVLLWVCASPALLFLALFTCLAVYRVIRFLIPSPCWAFALYGSLISLIGLANYFKLYYRTEPLVPYDILNVGPAFGIAGNMGMRLDRGLLLNLLLFALCLTLMGVIRRYGYKPLPPRPWWKAAILPLLSLVCLWYLTDMHHLAALGVEDIRYDQYRNYQTNGFVVSTLTNLSDSRVKSPADYSPEAVAALRSRIEAADAPAPMGNPDKPPHILVLQMEAYADPRLVDPRVVYPRDPFGPLAAYEGEMQKFRTLVSTIGGGTSNTEYEFLTGFNMYYCPVGVTPFICYMQKPRQSLATALSAYGYQNIVMHPHMGRFYSRDKVYPKLGFDRFVTEEEFDDPVYIGSYISDGSFGKKIVELFEEERGKGPLFLYAISIQNHGPYGGGDFWRDCPVALEDGLALSEAQIAELETFGANLNDSALMLANLIRYLSQVDEPVLLLVYGDHQAAWLWSMDTPGTPDVELRRYSTESFFWANYPLQGGVRPVVSASVLGSQTLRMAGLALPLYEKGIDLHSRELMAYNVAITVENDGTLDYAKHSRLESFLLLQYDRMFGGNYLGADID
ncbi:MAG: LTA synthase family protein [Clostridiales bacterium]|nr:LTA synthase family protein [Clostridiales bacterium]